jgi:hypothetical protein
MISSAMFMAAAFFVQAQNPPSPSPSDVSGITTIFARGEVIRLMNQARGHLVDPSERISQVLMLDPLGSAPYAVWPEDEPDESRLVRPGDPDRLLSLLLAAGMPFADEDAVRPAQVPTPELVVTDVRLLGYHSWTHVTLVVENLGASASAPVRLDAFVNPGRQPMLGERSRTYTQVPAIPAKTACLVDFWMAREAGDVRLLSLVLNHARPGCDLIEWNNVVNAYWL